MSDIAPAEAVVAGQNDYEVAGHRLYDALDSMYEWHGGNYPWPVVADSFAPYRQDGGAWMPGESDADRLTRGSTTVLAHPKCTVRAVLEQSQDNPLAYTLYVCRAIIDLDSYLMTYQDLSLQSYEVRGSNNLAETLRLADVFDLDDRQRRGQLLPRGIEGAVPLKRGSISFGDSRKYETAEGELLSQFEDSISMATSISMGIDGIGMSRREFDEVYGEERQSSGGTLARLARTAVHGAARLRLWPSGREQA